MSVETIAQVPARMDQSTTPYTIGSIDEICTQAFETAHSSGPAQSLLKECPTTTGLDRKPNPSTASRTATVQANRSTDSTCSNIPLRSSVDSTDLQISKTRLPEFRQSKRWARTYDIANVSRHSTASAFEHSSGQPRISDSAVRRSMDSVSSLQRRTDSHGDAGTIHRGFCGHVLLPDWHLFFKQARLNRQHSAVTKEPHSMSLRRQRSIDHIAPKTHTSPSRMAAPKRVRSKGRLDYAQAMRNLQSVIGLRCCGTITETQELNSHIEVTEPEQQTSTRGSFIPAEFWNSPRRSKRWSDDCRAMLRGEHLVDFDNEWRPEPFSADIGVSEHKDQLTHAKKYTRVTEPADGTAIAPPVPAKHVLAVAGPEPPERTSSKGISVARAAQVKKWGRQPVVVDVRDMICQDQHGVDAKIARCSSKLQQQIRRVPSSATTISRVSNKNLKNAKSIDSMAQIEAHLQSPIRIDSSMINLRHAGVLHKLKSRTSVNGTPHKIRTPAGEPPERPLPDLPDIKFDSGCRTVPHPLSKAGKRSARNMPDAKKEIKPPRPHHLPTSDDQYVGSDTSRANSRLIFNSVPISSTDATATKVKSHSARVLQGSLQRPMLKVKHLLTERSDKVHELKKRHITALSKHQQQIDEGENECHRSDITVIHRVSSIFEMIPVPPSRPPPPPPAKVERFSPHRAGSKFNKLDFSDDEFSVFPVPPVSRPASCESTATTPRSSRNHAQCSHNNSSLRQNRSRAGPHSDYRPSSQQGKQSKDKPKQVLSQSTIMIVCDTNPATENFRAGAKSPIPSITGLGSRSPTPRGQTLRSVNGRPGGTFAQAELVNIDELADFGKAGLKKKNGPRSLRSQPSFVRSPFNTVGQHAVKCTSSMSNDSQYGSRHTRYPSLESDSEQETARLGRSINPILVGPRTSSIRTGSRLSMRSQATQQRKTKAVTDGSEFHVEEMMRVIARYAGKGNKVARQMLQQSTYFLEEDKIPDTQPLARVTRSPRHGHGSHIGGMSEPKANIGRRISDKSVFAAADTDSDDSDITGQSASNRDSCKVASDGSLTDPTDHDTVLDINQFHDSSSHREKPRQSPLTPKSYDARSLSSPRSSNFRSPQFKSYSPLPPRPKTAASSTYSARTSTRTTATNTGATADEQLDSILRLLEAPISPHHPTDHNNRTSIVGTERLYGVVDGMKLWPDLTTGFGSGVVIETATGGENNGVRMLHSRFES